MMSNIATGMVGVALLSFLSNVGGVDVTFYSEKEFKGDSYRLESCMNLRLETWNDRVKSINTNGNCVKLWEDLDCKGKCVEVYPGSKGHSDLSSIGWDSTITSVSECTQNRVTTTAGTTQPPSTEAQPIRTTTARTTTRAPVSSTLQPTTEYPSYWRNQAMDVHNDYRARHGVGRLSLNSNLNTGAQKCADYLATNKIVKDGVCPQVFGTQGWGENVGQVREEDEPWTAAVAATENWYSEETLYSYEGNNAQPGTNHFTQMIWKNSSLIGIGYARNGDFKIVVAEYSPVGNIDGRYKDNVFTPSF